MSDRDTRLLLERVDALAATDRLELALLLLDSVLTEAVDGCDLDMELLRAAQFAHLDLAEVLGRFTGEMGKRTDGCGLALLQEKEDRKGGSDAAPPPSR